MSEISLTRSSHTGRRVIAILLGTGSTIVWFLISLSLWQAQIPTTWLQNLLLVAAGFVAFLAPCAVVWLIAHSYDWAKRLRR
jgi:hypothetical protein